MTDTPKPEGSPGPWRPLGVLYLAVLLLALAAGLWPEAIYPPRYGQQPVLLPALQTVAIAQAGFALLVYPLAVLRRAAREPQTPARRPLRSAAAEVALFFLVAAPFYFVGAFLADAVWPDVVRAVLYLACVWAFALAAGLLLRTRPVARTPVVLALVLIALALPAACYLVMEFLAPMDPGVYQFMAPPARLAWLWHLGPFTNAWLAAASRGPSPLPTPLWPCLLWLAGAGLCLFLTPKPKGQSPVS